MQHGTSGNTYALKSISKGYIQQASMRNAVANEKDVLYMTSSPFIIKLLEAVLHLFLKDIELLEAV